MHRLTVDELARGHDVVEDDGRLLAVVQDDVVALSGDLDSGTLALEGVHGLINGRVGDLNVGVVLEVFHSPLFALEFELGRLLHGGFGRNGGFGASARLAAGDNTVGTEVRVLMGLHVGCDLLESCRQYKNKCLLELGKKQSEYFSVERFCQRSTFNIELTLGNFTTPVDFAKESVSRHVLSTTANSLNDIIH